jgi:hypothetical protein
MNEFKTTREIQTAMPVRNQDRRLDWIDLSSNNADRDGRIGFVSVENFMGDKGFLLDDPDRPVNGSRAFFISAIYQHPFMPVICLLHNLEQPSILATGTDIMKYALIHFLPNHSLSQRVSGHTASLKKMDKGAI